MMAFYDNGQEICFPDRYFKVQNFPDCRGRQELFEKIF